MYIIGGMSESRESVIEIQDCDSEIFQGFYPIGSSSIIFK